MSRRITYEHALQLPQARYHHPEHAGVSADNTRLIQMEYTAVTYANSSIPIIGTAALASCLGIGVRNAHSHARMPFRTAVGHDIPSGTISLFDRLLSAVRKNTKDPVHLYVVGGEFNVNDRINDAAYVRDFVSYVSTVPHIILKVFDVGTKPHPEDFMIDSRNGRLIRGTTDIVLGNAEDLHDIAANAYNFDGTLSEFRRARSR